MNKRKLFIISMVVVMTAVTTIALGNNKYEKHAVRTGSDISKSQPTENPISNNTQEEEAPVAATPEQNTPTPQPSVQQSAATPEQNKANFQTVVIAMATVTLQHLPARDSASFLATQWACVDKLVAANPGYNDYESLLVSPTYVALKPITQADGTAIYRYFDNPGTCRIFSSDPS